MEICIGLYLYSRCYKSYYLIIRKANKPNPNYDKHNKLSSESWAPYQILNIGNSKKVSLIDFISCLEEILDKKAIKKFMPIQQVRLKLLCLTQARFKIYMEFSQRLILKMV